MDAINLADKPTPGFRFGSFAAILALCVLAPARGELETHESKSGPRVWPVVTPPVGWQHDREQSLLWGYNMILPKGATFENARAVMYAWAVSKTREPQLTSIRAVIDRNRRDYIEVNPGADVRPDLPLVTANGQRLESVAFIPRPSGEWERKAFGEEGDHWLVFAVSAHTEGDYKFAMKSYEAMVRGYRGKR